MRQFGCNDPDELSGRSAADSFQTISENRLRLMDSTFRICFFLQPMILGNIYDTVLH